MVPRRRLRVSGVLGNVARSLAAASPWVWAWVLPVTIAATVAAVADARTVDSIVRADEQSRQRGDHLLVVSATGMIEPRSCDALARRSGVTSAGAWRQVDTIHLAVLPDDAIAVIEITPGLLEFLAVSSDPPVNVLAGAGLAARLGSGLQHRTVPIPDADSTTVGSTRPSGANRINIDGIASATTVLPPLDRSFLAVGLLTGTFDSCAISHDRLTERDAETALLALAQSPTIDNLNVSTASGLPIDRITDANTELAQRSTARLAITTAALALLVGAFVSFFRRKEFIVLAISRWSRAARMVQVLGECVVLAIVPIAITIAVTGLLVPEIDTTAIALRTSILATTAATLGSVLPVATQRARTTLTTMRE